MGKVRHFLLNVAELGLPIRDPVAQQYLGNRIARSYDSISIALAEEALAKASLPWNLVVECSHANSFKNPAYQPLMLQNIVNQIRDGNCSIVGVMLESHIAAGSQPIPKDLSQLKYGCSVTDPCIDWETTEAALLQACERLRDSLPGRG